MTSAQFVIWFKGFVAGSNSYNLTPSGWETVKAELEKVNDDTIGFDWSMYPDCCEEDQSDIAPANEDLVAAAQKYKEYMEQKEKSEKSIWHSTYTT